MYTYRTTDGFATAWNGGDDAVFVEHLHAASRDSLRALWIPQAAALTGNDVYAIRDMIVDQEIRAVNPTGMQLLIPRDQVLKIMAGNVDNYPDDSASQ